jgi:hypothetical protein
MRSKKKISLEKKWIELVLAYKTYNRKIMKLKFQ